MSATMVGIEISAPHWRTPLKLDFEGLTERYGSTRAIELWDQVVAYNKVVDGDYTFHKLVDFRSMLA